MARKKLSPGTRVRLSGAPLAMDLDVLTGSVVGPATWDGYYIIRLDRPGRYRHADGRVDDLDEIREAWDNLEVLEPAKDRRASEAGRRA